MLPLKWRKAVGMLSEEAVVDIPDDPAELAEYTNRTKKVWQVIDPNDGKPILTDMDLKTICKICYRFLKMEADEQEIMDEGNNLRALFYHGRMALKYPKETADDPLYHESLGYMVQLYTSMEDTDGYDAISDSQVSTTRMQ